jgi:hypothetical protein
MSNKQVQAATQSEVAQQSQSKNLYVTVTTYDAKGKETGVRVVDMYHYGTRNWLQNHCWWAMHNSQQVEITISTDAEVDDYLARQTQALQDKFSKEPVAA